MKWENRLIAMHFACEYTIMWTNNNEYTPWEIATCLVSLTEDIIRRG